MALRMTTRSFADTTIVECSGRIVLGDESANFRYLVKDLLTKCKQVVLDLGGVTYIDSIGLGVLVGLLTSAQVIAFKHEPDRNRDCASGASSDHADLDLAVAGKALFEVVLWTWHIALLRFRAGL